MEGGGSHIKGTPENTQAWLYGFGFGFVVATFMFGVIVLFLSN